MIDRFRLGLNWTILISFVLMTACSSREGAGFEDDVLLAEVFERKLYLGDVKSLLYEGVTSQDSVLIVSAYVERWVRDQLLIEQLLRWLGYLAVLITLDSSLVRGRERLITSTG